MPRQNVGMCCFSFGPWMPSSWSANPSITVSMFKVVRINPTIGTEPPSRTSTGGFPKTDCMARTAACMPGELRFTTAGWAPARLLSVQLTEGGACCARYSRNWFATFAGSWLGTRRMEILAMAFAGSTVLLPSPVKPESMPFTSRVGRAPMRSALLNPRSP